MQLPFLQRLAPALPIVPLVMGYQTPQTARALGDALAAALDGRRALLVASTDLSHYHDAATAARLDATVIDCVSQLRRRRAAARARRAARHACGGGPTVAVMRAARQLGAARRRRAELRRFGRRLGRQVRGGRISCRRDWQILKATAVYDERSRSRLAACAGARGDRGVRRAVRARDVRGDRLRNARGAPSSRCTSTASSVAASATSRSTSFSAVSCPAAPSPRVDRPAVSARQRSPGGQARDRDLAARSARADRRSRRNHRRPPRPRRRARLASGPAAAPGRNRVGLGRRDVPRQTCHKAGLPQDAWKHRAKMWRFEAEVFSEKRPPHAA